MIVSIGVLYLRLPALPEHMAQGGHKVQCEIVAVPALIVISPHNHAVWIAGLLLALIPISDFRPPLRSLAGVLNRIADTPDGSPRPLFFGAFDDLPRGASRIANTNGWLSGENPGPAHRVLLHAIDAVRLIHAISARSSCTSGLCFCPSRRWS